MNECISDCMEALKNKLRSVEDTVDFYELFNRLALQIISKTAMGHKLDFDDPKAAQYLKGTVTMKKTFNHII